MDLRQIPLVRFTGGNSQKKKNGFSVDDARDYIALSLLSQANYCLRRAALIWNERAWIESEDTALGRAEHANVHNQRIERRGQKVKFFEYEVRSEKLSLIGKCDCIEGEHDPNGCIVPEIDFPLRLLPVEYKHGRERDELEYKIQLCSQAMCLEEMYNTHIPEGAIFFISAHKRQQVKLTSKLRESVITTAERLKKIRKEWTVPAPILGPKCKRCSLRDYCMPDVKSSAGNYCKKMKQEAKGELEL